MELIIRLKRRFFQFIVNLFHKLREDQLFFLSNWLTYRVMLAFFPFLVFLMSLLAFLHLDITVMSEGLHGILPEDVYYMVTGFFNETATMRNHALLSTSIFFVIFNSINGFRAITRCINNAYDAEDRRNVGMQAVLSVVLMLIFVVAIIVMLVILIFGRQIWTILETLLEWEPGRLATILSAVISFIVVTFVIMLIYKLSCAIKLKLRNVLPGAIFTVVAWILASILFGFFISNFSNMSAVYGSIAGIFILMLWLNLVSVILLLGNEINAYLYKSKQALS